MPFAGYELPVLTNDVEHIFEEILYYLLMSWYEMLDISGYR